MAASRTLNQITQVSLPVCVRVYVYMSLYLYVCLYASVLLYSVRRPHITSVMTLWNSSRRRQLYGYGCCCCCSRNTRNKTSQPSLQRGAAILAIPVASSSLDCHRPNWSIA